MKIEQFIEKSYYRFYKYIVAGKDQKYFYKGGIPKPQKIIFYLHDRKVIHLGDTLWFEPIIRMLSKHFEVAVYPNPAMEFYFRKLGYTIVTNKDINDSCILITPIELMYKLRHVKNDLFLSFDYKLPAEEEKLIDSMVGAVAGFFNLECNGIDAKYQKLEYTSSQVNSKLESFNMLYDEKYIIFNNYIDSWGKHTTPDMLKAHKNKLVNYAKSFKNENKKIKFIYVGSSQDTEGEGAILNDLMDLDLRGKTQVEDLFILANAPQIEAYIGFDTFLMHLFNMYDKPSHILLKPGQPENINHLITQRVLVPYSNVNDSLTVLIDHNKW